MIISWFVIRKTGAANLKKDEMMWRILNKLQTRHYTRRWYIWQIKWCMPWYRPLTHKTQTWLEQACANISPHLNFYCFIYISGFIIVLLLLCGENGFFKLLSLSLVSRKKPQQRLIQAKIRNKDVQEISVLAPYWDWLGSWGSTGLW